MLTAASPTPPAPAPMSQAIEHPVHGTLRLALKRKPKPNRPKYQGVAKTSSGGYQAFVYKKATKVGVGTFKTEEEAAVQRAVTIALGLENIPTPGKNDVVDMDFDSKMDNAPSAESSPLQTFNPPASSGPLFWPAYGFRGRKEGFKQSLDAQVVRRSGSHRTLLQRHYEAHPQLTPGSRTVQNLNFYLTDRI